MLQELILLITELMMRRKMESNSSGQNSLNMSFPKIILIFYLDSVLEHVLNPKEYLLKINSILKVGGVVYIGVPNEDCMFNDIRKLLFQLLGMKDISEKIKPFDSPYHVIGYNKESLEFIFNKTNLKTKFMRNFGRKFEFLSHNTSQRGFWIGLFLLPIEFIGNILNRDVYYEAYISKEI